MKIIKFASVLDCVLSLNAYIYKPSNKSEMLIINLQFTIVQEESKSNGMAVS